MGYYFIDVSVIIVEEALWQEYLIIILQKIYFFRIFNTIASWYTNKNFFDGTTRIRLQLFRSCIFRKLSQNFRGWFGKEYVQRFLQISLQTAFVSSIYFFKHCRRMNELSDFSPGIFHCDFSRNTSANFKKKSSRNISWDSSIFFIGCNL